MPELIQQRTMQRPGEGIVPNGQPTKQFQEYPKVMRHDGEAPATMGQKIKFGDPEGPGFVHVRGGLPARYQPVLVYGPDDEEHHKSLGYKTIEGKSSEAAFRRLVQEAAPRMETHVAQEYPKWVNGKLVNSSEEEADLVGKAPPAPQIVAAPAAGVPAPGHIPPAVSADDEIATLEARIAALKERKAKKAELERELAALEAEEEPPVVAEPEASEEDMEAYLAKRSKELDAAKPEPVATAAEITEAVAAEAAQADPLADEAAAKKKAKSEAIKAGLARRKAEKDAAA